MELCLTEQERGALTSLENEKDFIVVKDDCLSSLHDSILRDVEALRENLKPAVMGKGGGLWSDKTARGDLSCWITPDLCSEKKLDGMKGFAKQMMKECGPMKKALGLTNDFSIQLAVYPGSGEGYSRHLDSFKKDSNNKMRQLTFLYYLNAEYEGGNLRAFRPKHSSSLLPEYVDVEPKLGRLVGFRSDLVEHEVKPSFKERIAVTFWASGSGPGLEPQSQFQSRSKADISPSATVPKRLPLPDIDATDREAGTSNISNTSKAEEGENNNNQTFVGIISYRDSECQPTILDLYHQSSNPEDVYVGVVLQCDRSTDDFCFEIEKNMNSNTNPAESSALQKWWKTHVRTVEMHYRQAKGPCWARHLVGGLWQGETFYLQIDSHMRFRYGWDKYCTGLLRELRASGRSSKPVLSTYPLGYSLPDNVPKDTRPTLLLPSKFDNNGILRQEGKVVKFRGSTINTSTSNSSLASRCIRSPLWASGFSFSYSSVLHDVPYDPLLPFLFFGEESSMAYRLYSHGYDFFAPPEAILYHLWSRAHRPVFQEVCVEDQEARNTMRESSQDRVRDLLEGKGKDISASAYSLKYGAGTVRSLAQFEASAGVDFSKKNVLCVAEEYLSAVSKETKTGTGEWILESDLQDLLDYLAAADEAGAEGGTGAFVEAEEKGGEEQEKAVALSLVLQFMNKNKI